MAPLLGQPWTGTTALVTLPNVSIDGPEICWTAFQEEAGAKTPSGTWSRAERRRTERRRAERVLLAAERLVLRRRFCVFLLEDDDDDDDDGQIQVMMVGL